MTKVASVGRRFDGLDIFKGLLVLVMVIYHTAGAGVVRYPELAIFCLRTDPIHYSFLFVSGFVAGWYYAPRLARSGVSVRRRLRVRAVKLALLCLLPTAFLYAVGVRYQWDVFASSFQTPWEAICHMLLSFDGRFLAFEVLLIIALFLVVASLVVGRFPTWALTGCIPAFLALRPWSLNASFLAFGFAGLVVGLLWEKGRLFQARWKTVLAGGSVAFVLVTQTFFTEWHSFVASTGPARGLPVLLTIGSWGGCAAALASLHGPFLLKKWFLLLGRYSLLGYMTQMLLIHMTFPGFVRLHASQVVCFCGTLSVTLVILTVLLAILESARLKWQAVNALYKAVFG